MPSVWQAVLQPLGSAQRVLWALSCITGGGEPSPRNGNSLTGTISMLLTSLTVMIKRSGATGVWCACGGVGGEGVVCLPVSLMY